MIGVNIDNLKTLLKKNNSYLQSFNTNSKKMISIIKDLNSCYSGTSIEFLFSQPKNEIINIQTIYEILENYYDILLATQLSYQKQDDLLKTQISHIDSNL